MTATLDSLIEGEVSARVTLATITPPLMFGVWIPGKGWLKSADGKHTFADRRIEVAESAARLYGRGAVAIPVDERDRTNPDAPSAMEELEATFLAQERGTAAQRWPARLARWLKRQHGSVA